LFSQFRVVETKFPTFGPPAKFFSATSGKHTIGSSLNKIIQFQTPMRVYTSLYFVITNFHTEA